MEYLKMDENRSILLERVEEESRKRGDQGSILRGAVKVHLNRIVNSIPKEGLLSREEMRKCLLSKIFLDNFETLSLQPFVCRVTENLDWPVKPLPSEFFSPSDEKPTHKDRLKWFFFSLKVADVLDCIVCKISGSNVQLKVLHKHNSFRILNDLSIMVTLDYNKSEMQCLGNTLLDHDYIRVAVYKIDKIEEKVEIYVTADPENVQPFRPLPKLGKIMQSDIPFYNMKLPEKFSTYADYLNSKIQFRNPHFYSELFKEFGINPYEIYSCFPKFNRKTCPEEQTGQALLKKSKLRVACSKALCAIECWGDDKSYSKNLANIDEAIELCPEKDPFQSMFYALRSEIYAEKAKPVENQKSLDDLELAYFLNPQMEVIKEKFFERLVVTAKAAYFKKDFKTAYNIYRFLNIKEKDNPLYLRTLNYLKKKIVLHIEDEIIDLEERKKELLSELNICESQDFCKMES